MGDLRTPGLHTVTASYLPGIGESQGVAPSNLQLDNPTPVDTPLALTSQNFLPQTTFEAAPIAAQPMTNHSSDPATTINDPLFSHGTSHSHSSVVSHVAYTGMPGSDAGVAPTDAPQQPAAGEPLTGSAWTLDEENILMGFWFGENFSHVRLDRALTTNRTPKADSNLADEWIDLWQNRFKKSRSCTAIPVHWWKMVGQYFKMLDVLNYAGINPLQANPFPAEDDELGRMIEQARAAGALEGALSVATVRTWIRQGWYSQMTTTDVKASYNRLQNWTTWSDQSQSKSDVLPYPHPRPRPIKGRTVRTSASTSSLNRSPLIVSSTPPPGMMPAESPVTSFHQPSQPSYGASGSTSLDAKFNRMAEVHRSSTKVANHQMKVHQAKAGLLESVSQVNKSKAKEQEVSTVVEAIERIIKAQNEVLENSRRSLGLIIACESLSQEPRDAAAMALIELNKTMTKPSDIRAMIDKVVGVTKGNQSSNPLSPVL
ncbi:hypothetical protein RhiJN_23549 [Ceratobasidium sp. AG-Ba]|nr:hypothetical protein RhiJN_23549 [Ceratobasidium sp. AG-Ba]